MKPSQRYQIFPFIWTFALGIVFLALSAVGSGSGHLAATERHPAAYSALAQAPEKSNAQANPLDRDPSAVAAGKKLFGEHCAECHGREGEGGRRGPGLRALEVQNASPGAIFWVLSNGVVRRGMPDWSKLPEPERWQLVAFLKSLSADHPTRNGRVIDRHQRIPAGGRSKKERRPN
jgi:mono/diheme cytochrome c family protein